METLVNIMKDHQVMMLKGEHSETEKIRLASTSLRGFGRSLINPYGVFTESIGARKEEIAGRVEFAVVGVSDYASVRLESIAQRLNEEDFIPNHRFQDLYSSVRFWPSQFAMLALCPSFPKSLQGMAIFAVFEFGDYTFNLLSTRIARFEYHRDHETFQTMQANQEYDFDLSEHPKTVIDFGSGIITKSVKDDLPSTILSATFTESQSPEKVNVLGVQLALPNRLQFIEVVDALTTKHVDPIKGKIPSLRVDRISH